MTGNRFRSLRSAVPAMPARLALVLPVLCALAIPAAAKDIRINLPKRTKPTPAQKYNQKGVSALKKNHIKEAKKLFYKAYLLDPNDTFTLNNLGYVAELEGQVDRAQKYYELSAENASDAVVDKATQKDVEGMPANKVAGMAEEGPLQVNRLNVQAISMLQKDRPFEAEAILKKALAIDPNNPFSLNNMGFAQEKQGELRSALEYYQRSAAQNSREKVIVTVNKDWRGRPITQIAQRNVKKIERQLAHTATPEETVALLNLRGVSALNRNDRKAAREFFEQAYKVQPENAYTLNNMGYVAELDGDRETANLFYEKAQAAERAGSIVGVATRRAAEGKKLAVVADTNNTLVEDRMQQDLAAKRRAGANQPVTLMDRSGAPVKSVARPAGPSDDQSQPNPGETQPDQNKVVPDPSNQDQSQPDQNRAQPDSSNQNQPDSSQTQPNQGPPATNAPPQQQPDSTQPH